MRRRVLYSTLLVVLLTTISAMYAHCGDLDLQLLQSCKSGDLGEVESLVKKGARVNSKDGYGWTPLMVAAKEGHTAVVEYLLKQGADPNTPNSWGWFPISWAALQGHADVVKLLIKNGAKPDAKTDRTWTAETLAGETGDRNVLRALGKFSSSSAQSPRTHAGKAKPRPGNHKRAAFVKHKTPKKTAAHPAKKRDRVTKKPAPKKKPAAVKKPSLHGKPASARKPKPVSVSGPDEPRVDTVAPKNDLRAGATKTARQRKAEPTRKVAKSESKKAVQPSAKPDRSRVFIPPKKGVSPAESRDKKIREKKKPVAAPKGGSPLKAAHGKSGSKVTKPETIGKPKLVQEARPGRDAAAEKPRRKTAKAELAPKPKPKVGPGSAEKTAAVTPKKSVHRFRDKKGYFSVAPPPGWTRKDFPGEKKRSMILFHEPKNRNVSITVIALPKVKSKAAFFKDAEKKVAQLKSMFPKGRFKLEKSKLAGMDALVMENTIPGTVKQEIWQLRGSNAAYTITFLTSTESQFDEFLPLYKRFLKSFKPLSRGK